MKLSFRPFGGVRGSDAAAPTDPGTAGRRWLPALLPEWLLAIAGDGQRRGYRLRTGWDGRIRLEPATPPAGRRCIAVIDHSLPFRRRLQRIPETARARQALLQTAADEFPLPADELCCAMGIGADVGYLYAMPRAEIESLVGSDPQPVVLLVGGTSADDCLAALDIYVRHGPITSLLGGKRLLARSHLLVGALGLAGALLLGIAAWLALTPGHFEALAQRDVERLRRELGGIPATYAATELMIASEAERARLVASPEARAARILALALATIPPGCSVRSIDLKDNRLEIGGVGSEVRGWLTEAGFAPESISIDDSGGGPRFRAAATVAG